MGLWMMGEGERPGELAESAGEPEPVTSPDGA